MQQKFLGNKFSMVKSVAILQSNYIPWKGYFDLISKVDEFIIYDEVQYTKNDWRNRNKIKTANGVVWLTIPVSQKSLHQKICETYSINDKWRKKHWASITQSYSKAKYKDEINELLYPLYHEELSNNLSEINRVFIGEICKYLGITTKISSSSDYVMEGDRVDRLVNLCKQSGGSVYWSGPAAKDYLEEKKFIDNGISVQWMNYSYNEYPQLFPPFEHSVSIIDALYNMGPNTTEIFKNG